MPSCGESRSALSTRFATTWLISTWSIWSRARSSGMSIRMRPRSAISPNIPSASATSSSNEMAIGRSSSAPDSIRVMSSRLVTSRESRSVCFSMSSSSSARSCGSSWTSVLRRLETAVFTDASGVRRSCEAAPMSALRQRSISSSSRVRKAWSRSRALSTASAAWLAKVPSRLRSPASCASCSTRIPTGRLSSTRATETRVGVSASTNPSDRVCPPETSEVSSADVRASPTEAATCRRSLPS